MVRLIKRYGSRKLYDTEESRYVLLEDIAGWIRHGQQVRVIDSKTAEEGTAQPLTQIIPGAGRGQRQPGGGGGGGAGEKGGKPPPRGGPGGARGSPPATGGTGQKGRN